MPAKDQTESQGVLPGGRWSIDPDRSSVRFAIKHMALKTLHGSFKEFTGAIDLRDGHPTAEGSVSAASIDTGEAIRDGHLRESPDFFDVERHPEITFRSTLIAPTGG